jgi:hypothetical protein
MHKFMRMTTMTVDDDDKPPKGNYICINKDVYRVEGVKE